VNTLTRIIKVEIDWWPESPREWLQFIKEVGENLGWIWVSILVPLSVFALNRVRKYLYRPERDLKRVAVVDAKIKTSGKIPCPSPINGLRFP
jgi:hypothetical protein